MQWYRAFSFIFTSIATGLAAAFIVLLLRPDLVNPGGEPPSQPPPPPMARTSGPVSYADAVRRAAPAVVNVFATKITRQRQHPLLQDPVIRRFFGDLGDTPRTRRQNSLGSGVLIDSNGYVLTNNHVIADATEIQVVLGDGRSLPARVVGTDPETDLAVLQAAGDALPVAALGSSDDIQVGDVVMAIGNPFGVGQTVTQGIISATGRSELGITDFENFIQTDAAINPGNSGGALINALGDVIGINTAIFSSSGGSHGIGFAVPIQLAREVMRQLIEHGRVIRGWLGITGQGLTPELAESMELEYRPGILVSGVLDDGPGERAGLRAGDLIVALDGKPIVDAPSALREIASRPPGTPVAIQLIRDQREQEALTVIGERPRPNNRG